MPSSFQAESTFSLDGKSYTIFRLDSLKALADISRLPFSIRILLENLLRREDGREVTRADIEALAAWNPKHKSDKEIAFAPARVVLQDFTGVPAVVDLAAMREQIVKLGGDAKKINPLEPVDLVIDHSVQVDAFGSPEAFEQNVSMEFERNGERYKFLRWGQQAFRNFRVVPPGTGIVHQVNLEYLASVVMTKNVKGKTWVYPDTLVGTDSHTTMINGLGVLGWGVGGIEAEAAMLGQPVSMLIPDVVGFKLTGKLPEGSTATDLVLTVTEMLRKKGVVGKFVEFYGAGLASLSLADRATIANMAPEYGATMGFFPVDQVTLEYMRLTGRDEALIRLASAYLKEQNLFRDDSTKDPEFSDTLELDLASVEPSLAGPKRPQDRVRLSDSQKVFRKSLIDMMKKNLPPLDPNRLEKWMGEGGNAEPSQVDENLGKLVQTAKVRDGKDHYRIGNGAVVIAAITSCTNTSNPAVMIGAGLLAKKAVEQGLEVKPWVKTSLAPGSKVVMDYLNKAGLLSYLEKLKFHVVGFGCTTCIGNSGPLPPAVSEAVKEHELIAAAVLSGNRNFEGRINPQVKMNYLASPPLVVAYALAGTMDINLSKAPISYTKEGRPVYLKDLWPSQSELQSAMKSVQASMFQNRYGNVFEGDEIWRRIQVPSGDTFAWDDDSTYVKNPPYFDNMQIQPQPVQNIKKARILVMVEDSVTTDHISPAGSIPKDSPAGKYLIEKGIHPKDFNSYGARRGNHEVMMRGTFGNIRLRNLMAPGTEGGYTRHLPEGKVMFIYDAAMQYIKAGIPSLVIAGKDYGAGSSRDWAAKGPALLGVRAVIAESYERIHRSNLVGMGILPLQFEPGSNRETLGISGDEEFFIDIGEALKPGDKMICRMESTLGKSNFKVICRIDTPVEMAYYRHGGILHYVLRQLLQPAKVS